MKIVKINEKALGDIAIFRNLKNALKIDTKVLSEGVIKFQLKDVPLIVKDKKHFSIAAVGIEVKSDVPRAIGHVDEMCSQISSLKETSIWYFSIRWSPKDPEGS